MAYLGRQPTTGRYITLDDISGSFNGSTTTFNLTASGSAVTPQQEGNCIISISGVVQQPVGAYTVSGSQITFTSAPSASDTFFGTVLGEVLNIGTPTDATVSAASLSSSFFVKNAQTLTGLSLTGSENALLVGTVTVSGTITIPSGATVVIV